MFNLELEFYNELFKVMLLAIFTYAVSFGALFLFLVEVDSFNKGEKIFLIVTPLIITIIVLLSYGVKITGGF